MSNSPLVSYTKISPNRSSPRSNAIDRISVHCVVGQCTVETLGNIFASTSRQASSNYGVGKDGRIGMYVEEKDRSWCTSSSANDNRAVTIEVASDTTHPYAVTDAAYNGLIDLLVDIFQRNGKTKLLWFGDKAKTLAYTPQSNEMVMTVHRWFAAKSCPGDYLYNRHGQIADEVTRRLGGATVPTTTVSYQGKVIANDGLNCRTQPYVSSSNLVMTYPKGTILTITKEQNGWGFTGLGWVSLEYVEKINTIPSTEEDEDMDVNRFTELWYEMRKGLQDNDAGAWSQEARDWALSTGLIAGNGTTIDGQPNCMWADVLTREQMAQVLYRFAQIMGKA